MMYNKGATPRCGSAEQNEHNITKPNLSRNRARKRREREQHHPFFHHDVVHLDSISSL
jgi:hypothetical protein